MSSSVTASVVVIGNEILSGRTTDKNIPFLATELGKIGIQLREVRIIPDVETTIIETVKTLQSITDYVFTTGGIGPTHDDITSASIAKLCDVPLLRNDDAVAALKSHYGDEPLNEARLKMADIPDGATLIDNPVSGAPGFIIENIIVLAGVPRIMQAMFHGIASTLQQGNVVHSLTLRAHTAESVIAQLFASYQADYPTIEMGSYPFIQDGTPGTELVLRTEDQDLLQDVCTMLEKDLLNKDIKISN